MFVADLPLDPLTALARHPQLLLVVVGGAVWLFKRALAIAAANRPPAGDRRATAEAARRVGSGEPSGEGAEAEGAGDAEAERTRRVQAEVQRKIAERRGRPVAPPLVAPRPIASPLDSPFGWPLGRGPRPGRGEPAESEARERTESAPTDWRGRRGSSPASVSSARGTPSEAKPPVAAGAGPATALNAPTVRELTADVVARNARSFAAATAASAAAPAAPAGAALAAELREPNAARRAMLLREILGPPVALR
jgi:hypothetical protein